MPRRKSKNYADIDIFSNVLQPKIKFVAHNDYDLKGNWNANYFKNNNPIILELGCGKGEYTVGLAKLYPEKNFIGIDINGARIWRGAKTALEENISNLCFVRTRIDLINSFFVKDEVSQIWITFPDPQIQKQRKRLTSSLFLNRYKEILNPNGIIHLKTDNLMLHKYTLDIIKHNNLKLQFVTNDLYKTNIENETTSIQTFYEEKYLEKNMPITYLKFQFENDNVVSEPY